MNCSTSMSSAANFSSLCSPPLTSPCTQVSSMLETAAEQLMVYTDFQAAFETCTRGLQSLTHMECGEFKAGFCILGIQALQQEKIPAKIMQMCILLYSKVGEPAVMHAAARVWLHCPSNSRVTGFGTVAELYLLHVLVPTGQNDEALELIMGEVGNAAFTEGQRQAALEVLEEKEQQLEEAPLDPRLSPDPEISLPSSFMWISKLLQLLKQMWKAMFAPYYQALPQSTGL
uniref:Peroxisomal biogenesis factor 26 n=1 Tax=Labrus bergylta TaxID=56723 RepID=A0A3Q3G3I9_9LABR